jgi:hypothetical protein
MSDHKILEETILEMLLERGEGKSICPSEVVRRLYPLNWREKMDDVRTVARELVAKDKIEITQKGEVVNSNSKGAVRLRLKIMDNN